MAESLEPFAEGKHHEEHGAGGEADAPEDNAGDRHPAAFLPGVGFELSEGDDAHHQARDRDNLAADQADATADEAPHGQLVVACGLGVTGSRRGGGRRRRCGGQGGGEFWK